MDNNFFLTEGVNRALHVMPFTIHTRSNITPFELHHGRNLRTEITNLIIHGKSSYLLVGIIRFSGKRTEHTNLRFRKHRGEVSNHIVMARTKTEEKR